ncbi:hypothetical protein J6590_108698 [Homalodisca vitripennis]|nr:hypothetical protein J6590_108629 [Homalodisca vitripennis]KAG8269861.1 hypothetical protein J6590_108698 [Homalodisca vitripennis]
MRAVTFGGKNKALMPSLTSSSASGWDEALSRIRRALRGSFLFSKKASTTGTNSSKNHCLKIRESIHAFFWFVYVLGNVSTLVFLKARGFLYLPITTGLSFKLPAALAHPKTVTRSLDFLYPGADVSC